MILDTKKSNRRLHGILNKTREKKQSGNFTTSLFSRANRLGSKLKLKRILGLVILLVGFGICIAAVGTISLWLYGKAITSDFFTTRHIDIAGNVRLSRDMVLRYGGISEGDNSLAVSIGDVERNLRATPWVDEVSVKRLLPDRFVIKLKERLPSFWKAQIFFRYQH